MSVAIQGVAFEYGKIFLSDGKAWLAKRDCFGSFQDVDLLIGHEGKSYANTDDDDLPLQIHSGPDALVFRGYFSDWLATEIKDQTDCLESYLAVSIGFTVTKSDTVQCEGVPVTIIVEGKLNEISLVDEPVIESSYARAVSPDSCDSLAEDYERFRTVGRFIGLHRKVLAHKNGGKVEYKHIVSSYDVAANRFVKALAALAA